MKIRLILALLLLTAALLPAQSFFDLDYSYEEWSELSYDVKTAFVNGYIIGNVLAAGMTDVAAREFMERAEGRTDAKTLTVLEEMSGYIGARNAALYTHPVTVEEIDAHYGKTNLKGEHVYADLTVLEVMTILSDYKSRQ